MVKSGADNSPANETPKAEVITSEDKDRLIEIWKKAVETQMHFNEMSGKSRQLGLTFVAAALGVAVVMLARGDDFVLAVANWKLHVAVAIILAAVLALLGVRRLDLSVYHRMLRGAVTFGEDFEKNYMSKIFDLEKGMTQAISHYSRFSDAGVDKSRDKYSYTGKENVTAEQKIRAFYRDTIWGLLLASVALFFITNFAVTPASPKTSTSPVIEESKSGLVQPEATPDKKDTKANSDVGIDQTPAPTPNGKQ